MRGCSTGCPCCCHVWPRSRWHCFTRFLLPAPVAAQDTRCNVTHCGWLVSPGLETQPSPSIHTQGVLFLSFCAGHARSHAQLAGGGAGQVCAARLLDPRPRASCFCLYLVWSWLAEEEQASGVAAACLAGLIHTCPDSRLPGFTPALISHPPLFSPALLHASHSAPCAEPCRPVQPASLHCC